MDNSIDLIAHQISECVEKIEAYRHAINQLRQKIRELSWQVIETDDGEIAHYDDVA
jgi:peptidoglycan hydrolase CwlO-like protein